MAQSAQQEIINLLKGIDIEIGGSRPQDIHVHNEKIYDRVMSEGSIGLGEAYMDGWWDANNLDEFFTRVLGADLQKQFHFNIHAALLYIKSRLLNIQRLNVFEIGEHHYDIGNDLYERMLDARMTYTCGYWKDAQTLNEAQEAKLDLVCKKINLQKGQRVLDIGSGWGSFIHFAAEKYGAQCVGLTVSKEQAEYANAVAREKELSAETRVQDYQDVNEQFDHVVSIGMFEHVGYKNYRSFMEKVHYLLKDDGLFLLHTIGANTSRVATDPWIEKYIFPGGMLPSVAQVGESIEKLFVMEDWHNFGADYDTTLMQWHTRFNERWPEIKEQYGERFYRMWTYYLLASAGSFRCRKNQLWQIVLSKHGVPGGCTSVR